MLAFVFLPAIYGDSRCSASVPLTNTVLLLGVPMLPTWWVKISTYLHLEPFHLIAYMLLVLDRILLLSSSLLCSSFLFNSDLHYYIIIIIIPIILICIITIIILLTLLISLNYYRYYNILFRNSNDFYSQLSFLIIFVCLPSAIMRSCNLSFTLCCVCPLCTYVYLHCAVSVIGLVAVDSAHK
jgi:hypothetical protein